MASQDFSCFSSKKNVSLKPSRTHVIDLRKEKLRLELRKLEIEDGLNEVNSSLKKAKIQRDGIRQEFKELAEQEELERIAKMKKGTSISSKKRRLYEDSSYEVSKRTRLGLYFFNSLFCSFLLFSHSNSSSSNSSSGSSSNSFIR